MRMRFRFSLVNLIKTSSLFCFSFSDLSVSSFWVGRAPTFLYESTGCGGLLRYRHYPSLSSSSPSSSPSSSSSCKVTTPSLSFSISKTSSSPLLSATSPSSSSPSSTDPPVSSSSSSSTYDLVVIGGGSAGLTAAKFAATFDKSVILIERNRFGGDCTWTGCVPSKTIIASGKVGKVLRNSNKYGILRQKDHDDNDSAVRVDMKMIRNRVYDAIDKIYKKDDSPEAMTKLGIDTLTGKATLLSSNKVRVVSSSSEGNDVTTNVIAKDGIVLATGASPRRPTPPAGGRGNGGGIKGLHDIEYLTYEEIFDLDYVPERMTIVGGGPIGCELSQVFCRLGAKVTQVASRLLPREEPEASDALERIFEREGITLVRGTVTSVEPIMKDANNNNKNRRLHIAICSINGQKDELLRIEGDVMLLAVGRKPNVHGMGLEELGIKFNNRGGIDVDDKLRTSVKGVYAAGDCTGGKQFTHYAGYQGAIAARNALLPLADTGVTKNVPATTFTSPEVASIGLTEAKAKEEYGSDSVAVAISYLKNIDRAICEDELEGFIKVVYKKKDYEILGATIMSPVSGEMISEISVAMKNKLSFDMLATAIHPYPAYSFELQSMAADVYYEKLKKFKGVLNVLKKLGL